MKTRSLLVIAAGVFALALTGCSVMRNADGTTAVGAQLTAADLFAAWDRYEAMKVHDDK